MKVYRALAQLRNAISIFDEDDSSSDSFHIWSETVKNILDELMNDPSNKISLIMLDMENDSDSTIRFSVMISDDKSNQTDGIEYDVSATITLFGLDIRVTNQNDEDNSTPKFHILCAISKWLNSDTAYHSTVPQLFVTNCMDFDNG